MYRSTKEVYKQAIKKNEIELSTCDFRVLGQDAICGEWRSRGGEWTCGVEVW